MPPLIDYTQPLELLPDPLPIEPLRKPFDVTITPPGSKSITCRAYVLAALAEGESKIIRPLRADDTDHLLDALCTLGAEARWDGEDVYIKGVAGRFPRGGNLYMGDGGAPTRFMIACACLAKEPVLIDASPRMRERPIAEGVDMLRQLGARIEYVEKEGRLPVRVTPSDKLLGGKIQVGLTQSSQFVSALMLIAPSLADGVKLQFDSRPTSAAYIWLTVDTLRYCRVRHRRNLASRFSKRSLRWLDVPNARIRASSCSIEVDASSALYWALATVASPRSKVFIASLPIWTSQPDFDAMSTLARFGAGIVPYERTGDGDGICVESEQSSAHHNQGIDCGNFPDGSISLAIAAILVGGRTRLDGLATLRVKETDRIAALANELRKVGCTVETGEDWISITPPTNTIRAATVREREDANSSVDVPGQPKSANALPHGRGSENPVIIETYNDHRMAMAFAILGLVRSGISIRNPACVKKSYPGFWKDFAKLYAD